MRSQAFLDVAVSLAICLLFAVLITGICLRACSPYDATGLNASINGAYRLVSGLVEQMHYN